MCVLFGAFRFLVGWALQPSALMLWGAVKETHVRNEGRTLMMHSSTRRKPGARTGFETCDDQQHGCVQGSGSLFLEIERGTRPLHYIVCECSSTNPVVSTRANYALLSVVFTTTTRRATLSRVGWHWRFVLIPAGKQ